VIGRRILGREPAAWAGLVQGLLALALSLHLVGLTAENVGLIMACFTAAMGVYVAWATRDTMLGVIVALVNSSAALAIGYGLDLSTETTSATIAVVTVLVGFFQRTQTSPADPPLAVAA